MAKAARADRLAGEIVAVGRRRERLEPALRDGVVDRITTDIAAGVAGADLCILATPVATLGTRGAPRKAAAPQSPAMTNRLTFRHEPCVTIGPKSPRQSA